MTASAARATVGPLLRDWRERRRLSQLEVPLRERNQLLLAAGHAPVFGQHELDEPEMTPVRDALELILKGHDPYPAVVVDRAWERLAANRAVGLLIERVAPELLEPPLNVMRRASIPTASRRTSPTSASGAHTCSAACAAKPRSPAIPP